MGTHVESFRILELITSDSSPDQLQENDNSTNGHDCADLFASIQDWKACVSQPAERNKDQVKKERSPMKRGKKRRRPATEIVFSDAAEAALIYWCQIRKRQKREAKANAAKFEAEESSEVAIDRGTKAKAKTRFEKENGSWKKSSWAKLAAEANAQPKRASRSKSKAHSTPALNQPCQVKAEPVRNLPKAAPSQEKRMPSKAAPSQKKSKRIKANPSRKKGMPIEVNSSHKQRIQLVLDNLQILRQNNCENALRHGNPIVFVDYLLSLRMDPSRKIDAKFPVIPYRVIMKLKVPPSLGLRKKLPLRKQKPVQIARGPAKDLKAAVPGQQKKKRSDYARPQNVFECGVCGVMYGNKYSPVAKQHALQCPGVSAMRKNNVTKGVVRVKNEVELSSEPAAKPENGLEYNRNGHVEGAFGRKTFWDGLYKSNAVEPPIKEWFRRADTVIKKVQEKLPGKKAKILELGCGKSTILIELKKGGFKNLTGCDFSEHAIEQQRAAHPGIFWKEEDCRNMSFDDNSFDFMISKGFIDGVEVGAGNNVNPDNFDDLVKVGKEIHRTLKPGGIWICVTAVSTKKRLEFIDFMQYEHDIELKNVAVIEIPEDGAAQDTPCRAMVFKNKK